MIFHAPYPMELNPTSASRLRPLRMREAFKQIGYEVVDLSGSTPQRKASMKHLKELLRSGKKPDFLYSENSTQPNVFSTTIRDGFAPTLDTRIMRMANNSKIPVGMFYRDIYWKFSSEKNGLLARLSPTFHKLDMKGYLKAHTHFFLPSEQMAEYLDLPEKTSYSALPPAGDSNQVLPLPDSALTLFYVGGIGAHYKLNAFIDAARSIPQIRVNLVTRKKQWDEAIASYPTFQSPQIHPYHLNANELDDLYAQSHIGVLAVEPSDYRRFAVPLKLFEYLSRGRPILVTEGTEAARIVSSFNAGWVVPYTAEAIAATLRRLQGNRAEVQAKAANAVSAAKVNTWADRARTVADTLTGKSK